MQQRGEERRASRVMTDASNPRVGETALRLRVILMSLSQLNKVRVAMYKKVSLNLQQLYLILLTTVVVHCGKMK